MTDRQPQAGEPRHNLSFVFCTGNICPALAPLSFYFASYNIARAVLPPLLCKGHRARFLCTSDRCHLLFYLSWSFDYLIMSCLFLVGELIQCLVSHQNELVLLLLLKTSDLGWNKSI
jgi:hypothetical protein